MLKGDGFYKWHMENGGYGFIKKTFSFYDISK